MNFQPPTEDGHQDNEAESLAEIHGGKEMRIIVCKVDAEFIKTFNIFLFTSNIDLNLTETENTGIIHNQTCLSV